MLENPSNPSSIDEFQQRLLQEEIQMLREKPKKVQKQKHYSHFDEEYETEENEGEQQYRTGFNTYADKQLMHLVLTEEFDFQKISQILRIALRHDPIDCSEENCRERWWQLHNNRKKGKKVQEKIMEDKRIQSIMAFSNPYSLYDVDELITTLQKNQTDQRFQKNEEPVHQGYNIFKDNFRKIDDWEEYNKRQSQMKQALERAQQEQNQEMPLIFSPDFEKLKSFEVKGEQLTADKAKKMMAFQIEMEKVSREMNLQNDLIEEEKYKKIIKKKVEMQKKQKEYELEENWDEYESD